MTIIQWDNDAAGGSSATPDTSCGKTLSDLRTAVRDALDEPTPARWANAQLDRYLNQAMFRVWNEVRRLRKDYFVRALASTDETVQVLCENYDTANLAVTVNGTTMELPADFAELVLFEVTTSGREQLRFVWRAMTDPLFRAAREQTTAQDPDIFYFDIYDSRTLIYAPLSSVALDTRLFYVFRPAELSGDDTEMEMPAPLDLAVVWYAVASAMAQDLAPEAALYEQRAKSVIAEMVATDSRVNQDPQTAISAYADFFNG